MNDKIELGALYKLKEDKSLSEAEEFFTSYVIVENFLTNPLEQDKWYVEFVYCYKEDLELITHIYPFKFLPFDIFDEYFELDMSRSEVNQLIYLLQKREINNLNDKE